ncbi:hypothetical protein [Acetobacter senegalensis]|uniref:hypothetical protein n=1 Tax=Acetobacter senegalensis TaxID=446692 RepID=UPI001EDB1DE2|nr:hypothetical protein [Acetobacter senegalensis]MCG4258028.1 hypothetical protein [Acetobacter senegalensis]MCG4267955.1 hypothetical protein [Acetobacter senegalensis]
MTWQLFSPDLPFLNQITVSQVKNGFWECISPYTTFVGTLISVSAAVLIAREARKITAEQKRIAQEKLDLDLFDKRYKIINGYNKYYSTLLSKVLTINDIQAAKTEFHVDYIFFKVFFQDKYKEFFVSARKNLYKLSDFREGNLDRRQFTKEQRKEFASLARNTSPSIFKIRDILNIYSPLFVKLPPNHVIERQSFSSFVNDIFTKIFTKPLKNNASTAVPTSHPEPQPAAPEQAQ